MQSAKSIFVVCLYMDSGLTTLCWTINKGDDDWERLSPALEAVSNCGGPFSIEVPSFKLTLACAKLEQNEAYKVCDSSDV